MIEFAIIVFCVLVGVLIGINIRDNLHVKIHECNKRQIDLLNKLVEEYKKLEEHKNKRLR